MEILFYIICAGLVVAVLAISGALTLFIKREHLPNFVLYLVALSAGALTGGAFLHLLPEAGEKLSPLSINITVLIAIVVFFLVEKVLHWRHCHKESCEVHTFGHMNLFGDSIHNFLDGLVIAGAFLADIKLGITTTVAVALHEIPQEIGDFGVLLHSGFKPKRALFLNFLVALMVLVGGFVGFFLSNQIGYLFVYVLPFAAGGFIYIAASDLLPEIRKEQNLKKSAISFMVFLFGILIMILAKIFG